MNETTIFIHRTKDESHNKPNTQYRLVTFIGGNKDIVDIIKELIKNKYTN